MDLICRLDTHMINLNFFIVMPGADIYYRLIEEGKISPVTDLRTMAEEDPIRQLEYNYSNIPDLDIKVIRSYFMWRSLKDFLTSMWDAGVEFLQTAWYANAYPAIRRKYGISNGSQKKTGGRKK